MKTNKFFVASSVLGIGLVAASWVGNSLPTAKAATTFYAMWECGGPSDSSFCPQNLNGSGATKAITTATDDGAPAWHSGGGVDGGGCGSRTNTDVMGSGAYNSRKLILVNGADSLHNVAAFRDGGDPGAGARGAWEATNSGAGGCKAYQRALDNKWIQYTGSEPPFCPTARTTCTVGGNYCCDGVGNKYDSVKGSERYIKFYAYVTNDT